MSAADVFEGIAGGAAAGAGYLGQLGDRRQRAVPVAVGPRRGAGPVPRRPGLGRRRFRVQLGLRSVLVELVRGGWTLASWTGLDARIGRVVGRGELGRVVRPIGRLGIGRGDVGRRLVGRGRLGLVDAVGVKQVQQVRGDRCSEGRPGADPVPESDQGSVPAVDRSGEVDRLSQPREAGGKDHNPGGVAARA